MIAGTLAQLESSADDPLSSWLPDGGRDLPAIDVENSQTTHSDAVAQTVTVASRVGENCQTIDVSRDARGGATISTERVTTTVEMATTVYADVVGSGLVLAESVSDSDEERPFPLDLVMHNTGQTVDRLAIDVTDLWTNWDGSGTLDSVWMAGSDAGVGTNIAYHGATAGSDHPTIGLGFERAWSGMTMKGVVYESGYVALYDARTTADGLQFIDEELLPYTRPWDPEEQTDQADFDEFGGAD